MLLLDSVLELQDQDHAEKELIKEEMSARMFKLKQSNSLMRS